MASYTVVYTAAQMAARGAFRAVTHLELSQQHGGSNMQPFRSLDVQRLVLVDYHGLEDRLLVPGAFTALQSLHIQEPVFTTHCCEEDDPFTAQYCFEQTLITWECLLALPYLGQLSGSCRLFDIGMDRTPGIWRQVKYSETQRSGNPDSVVGLPSELPTLTLKKWVRQLGGQENNTLLA